MKLNWKKGIGFGVLLWIIVFVIICIFVAYKIPTESSLAQIIFILLSAIVVFILTGFVKPVNTLEAVKYGLVWVVAGIILDLLISQRFAPGMFSSVYYWIRYALVVVVPILRVKKSTNQM